jgi:hypothetical protein
MRQTFSISGAFDLTVRSLRLSLEALCLQRRIDNDRFPASSHRLGISWATLVDIRGADLSRRFRKHIETIEIGSVGETTLTRLSLFSRR